MHHLKELDRNHNSIDSYSGRKKNNEHDTMGKLCHIYAYLPVCSSNIGRLEEE